MRKIEKLAKYPPLERIFSLIKDEPEAAFLDSSLQGELGRYSILARRPYLKLVKGDRFTVNGAVSEIPFEEYVKTYLRENYEENDTGLPLVSGAVGYFSYDYGREKEGVASRHGKEPAIAQVRLTFYDEFIIEDHREKALYLIANGHAEENAAELEELHALVRRGELIPDAELYPRMKADAQANFTKQEYMDAVQHMIDYITEGDIYVVNMTQQLEIQSDMEPYTMFRRLRRDNPSPFGAYLNYGDVQIVCASPERFLQMKGGRVQTRPIKGTRRRGATAKEDLLLKEELACSEKDQSELLMIVDLERNDLNRVCIPGSVKVTELFSVETYATVFHLIANVEGRLCQGLTSMDLLEAAFPGGSITGAPKLRAMELIDQEEHSRRSLYTGSIGYISLNGDCDFNIVIRTAVYYKGVYHIGVGGGITCESELEFEYEETLQKARALLDALDAGRP